MSIPLIKVLTLCILINASNVLTFQQFLRVRSEGVSMAISSRLSLHPGGDEPSFGSTSGDVKSVSRNRITAQSPMESETNTFTVQITHNNLTTTFQIFPGESILAALERLKIHDQLSLPSLPHECRRGHCLTCSGKHRPNSEINNVEIIDDGLSPAMKSTILDKNLVLTCSSYVKGDGVKLELGVNNEAWKSIWSGMNYDDEEGERIRADAVAKTIRLADEKNFKKWVKKTEKMLSDGH